MRFPLAFLFFALAAAKALDAEPFEAFVHIQFGLGKGMAPILAWAVVAAEVVIGLALILPASRLNAAGAWVALVVAVVGILMALRAPEVPCGCFGAFIQATAMRRMIVGGVIGFVACTILVNGVHSGRHSRREVI